MAHPVDALDITMPNPFGQIALLTRCSDTLDCFCCLSGFHYNTKPRTRSKAMGKLPCGLGLACG